MFYMSFSPLHLRYMNDFRLSRYMENRSGDRFSPCRTPMLQLKISDCASVVNATLDFAFSYMFFMTSNNVDLFMASYDFFYNQRNSIIIAHAYKSTNQVVISEQNNGPAI